MLVDLLLDRAGHRHVGDGATSIYRDVESLEAEVAMEREAEAAA